jgi:hypothetical protein
VFWEQWWESRRQEIAFSVNLPVVNIPSRYNVSPAQPLRQLEISMEVRLQTLLNMTAPVSHYHAGSGTFVEGAPPEHPDILAGVLDDKDRQAFTRVAAAVNAKLEQWRQHVKEMIATARLRSTQPDIETARAVEAERVAALTAGVQELRSSLSSEGWQSLERFLINLGISAFQPDGP